MSVKGVFLLNLGTPDGAGPNRGFGQGPTTKEVRRYLREFLMDPYVVDIPAIARWLLVHAVILPRRPARSAEAYRKIWTQRGSPLLVHLDDLVAGVSARLGAGYKVVGGMRYGNPSIEKAFQELKTAGVEEVRVIPLYPQYSLAATESSIEECRRVVRKIAPALKLSFQPPFYGESVFLDAFAAVARKSMEDGHDHLIFSFHGLPERQVKKTDPTGRHCLASEKCCDQMTKANVNCYRAQCFATARGLASRLGVSEDSYSIGFQSRLGVTPWIRPYTDHLYAELAARGHKRVVVMCPAFVADCLETLEEVAIRGNEQFRSLGGEWLRLIPSLNSAPEWVDAVAHLVQAEVQS
ncbi:MAG: ferrochelatase [Oligoflexia bacterium]|nr:ferrochelatase [Oligoflexia bacterium]